MTRRDKRRRFAVGALIVAISAIAGGCGSSETELTLQKARSDASAIVAEAEDRRDEVNADVDRGQAQVRRLEKAARSQQAKLRRLQEQVDGAKQVVEANTIPGTGRFVVGEDIEPGIYRAEAKPGCYWARLGSLDNSDINENENADGPVVVEILSSDGAFEAQDCADFTKSP